MTSFSGSFSGRAQVFHSIALDDTPGHSLETIEIGGPQSSDDANWNGSKVTYWGCSDLIHGNGKQWGYYVNERPDGSRDAGTFEGKVTTTSSGTTVEGTFRMTGGTGKFSGLSGQGTYKTRITSPVDVEAQWEGSYQLAASAQAA